MFLTVNQHEPTHVCDRTHVGRDLSDYLIGKFLVTHMIMPQRSVDRLKD